MVMKDSGCPVPNYMLEMKRLHKNTRRKLEKQSVARDEIRAKPHRYKRLVAFSIKHNQHHIN